MIRKVNIVAWALLALLLLASCAVTRTASTESVVSETNAPIITEITYPQADGYDLFSVGMLDANTPIVILGTGKEDSLKKIYKMNLSENTSKLIYEGEGRGSYFAIYAKFHPNNTYSIQFENENAFIFDASTDQIINTIDFSQVEGTFFNISNNGKRVVYESREGLCVSDLDMKNETLVYKSGEMSPFWPVFSNDDGKIAFPMAEAIGEATRMEKCVIYDLGSKESVMFDCSATALFWPSDNDGLLACDDGTMLQDFEGGANIWFFNLAGHEMNRLNVKNMITPMGVIKQGMLYYHNPTPSTEASTFRDYKIALWNPQSGDQRELDLGYQFAWINLCRISPSGNQFLMDAGVVIDGEAVRKVLLVDLG